MCRLEFLKARPGYLPESMCGNLFIVQITQNGQAFCSWNQYPKDSFMLYNKILCGRSMTKEFPLSWAYSCELH